MGPVQEELIQETYTPQQKAINFAKDEVLPNLNKLMPGRTRGGDTYTTDEMKTIARQLNLNSSKGKKELYSSILDFMEENGLITPIDVARNKIFSGDEGQELGEAKFKVAELKSWAGKMGLSTAGARKDIYARIVAKIVEEAAKTQPQ